MRRNLLNFFTLVTAVATGLLLGAPSVTGAEEAQATPELPDKFMIRGGWAYVWGASETLSFPGVVTGVGTSVDFAKTLGGSTSTDALRIDTSYRFNEHHSMGVSWYRVGL